MAKLIKDDKREKALDKITALLREVSNINVALDNSKKGYSINTTADKKKINIKIDSSLSKKVVAVLNLQRSKLVKEIYETSEKYRVYLAPEDEEILNGHLPDKEEKASEKEEPKPETEPEKASEAEANSACDDIDDDDEDANDISATFAPVSKSNADGANNHVASGTPSGGNSGNNSFSNMFHRNMSNNN